MGWGGGGGGIRSCSESESYWFTQSRCSLTSSQLLIMKRGWSSGEADEANPTAFAELRTRRCRLMPGLLEPISATHICPYTVYIVRVQAMHSSMFVQPQRELFFSNIYLIEYWLIYSQHTFLFFLYLRIHFHFFRLWKKVSSDANIMEEISKEQVTQLSNI